MAVVGEEGEEVWDGDHLPLPCLVAACEALPVRLANSPASERRLLRR